MFAVPIFSLLDLLLKNNASASWLFERTRNPENIRATLQSVYVNKGACDDTLVSSIATAAKDPNALKVQSYFATITVVVSRNIFPNVALARQNPQFGAQSGGKVS